MKTWEHLPHPDIIKVAGGTPPPRMSPKQWAGTPIMAFELNNISYQKTLGSFVYLSGMHRKGINLCQDSLWNVTNRRYLYPLFS